MMLFFLIFTTISLNQSIKYIFFNATKKRIIIIKNMNDDIKTSINLGPEDPFDRHHIVNTNIDTDYNNKKKSLIIVFYFFKKLKNSLPSHLTVKVLETLKEKLKNFQFYLEELEETDVSQDMNFLQDLSKSWNDFIIFFHSISINDIKLMKNINILINEINTYPESQEFSFGYYLTEYAGMDWIPFPYMEMLKDFHLAYKTNSGDNILKKWIEEIEILYTIC